MSIATPGLESRPLKPAARSPFKIGTALNYVALLILSAVFLLPFYLIFRNALLTQPQILSFDWVWLPIPPHFENVQAIFDDPLAPMAIGLRNSAAVGVIQTVGQIFIASLAGYGLARIPYRHSNLVFYAMLLTLMIPGAVTFVPLFVLVSWLGWVNTIQGLIVPGLFSTFAAFLFRQFYLEFPKDLEEAGRVDGLSYWGIYRYILLPNSLGIMMSLGMITFIHSWNAFLWPLIIGQTSDWWTVQVVLSTYLTAQTINLPALFMGAAIAVLPLVVLFIVAQRYIVEGVATSGIKG
jgi:multiple sugar transport system permease protein